MVAAGTIGKNGDSHQHKSHQTHNLDKYVDENAGNGQAAAKVCTPVNESRSDDVTADERNRNQEINRFTNKSHANKGQRRTSYDRHEEKPPCDAGRSEGCGSDKYDEHRSPSRAGHSLSDRGKSVIRR